MIQSLFYILLFIPVSLLSVFCISYPFPYLRVSESITKKIYLIACSLTLILSVFISILLKEGSIQILLYGHFVFNLDSIRVLLYLFSVLLISLVSFFSFQYLKKEIGFSKFFLNISLFWVGEFLFIFEGCHELLLAGWECIGISSIFLIVFYHYKRAPILNSLYVLGFYKVSDIILASSLIFLSLPKGIAHREELTSLALIGIVIAGLVKSASFPFTSWITRAMEGPTPSSAIYYAALSINTGVLLIFKFLPQILSYESSAAFLLISGIATVFYSSIVGRVQTDMKSTLAFSASSQIGFVLIELYFGFLNLALCHLVFSSFLKVFQFLRSPSVLHIYHAMETDHGKSFSKNGVHFQYLLPKKIRKFLYFIATNNFYLDSFILDVQKLLYFCGRFTNILTYPFKHQRKVKKRDLIWWIHLVVFIYLIRTQVIIFNADYLILIPIAMLCISINILYETKINTFFGLFTIYELLQVLLLQVIHSRVYYDYTMIMMSGLLMVMVLKHDKTILKVKSHKKNYFLPSLIIFMLLSFTNLPFGFSAHLQESTLEILLSNRDYVIFVVYALANTIFNISFYYFVFHQVYLKTSSQQLRIQSFLN